MEPNLIVDEIAQPSAWLMPGLLSRWHSVASRTCLAKLCWSHSGHVVEST